MMWSICYRYASNILFHCRDCIFDIHVQDAMWRWGSLYWYKQRWGLHFFFFSNNELFCILSRTGICCALSLCAIVDHWNVSCIACKSPGCAVNKIWCGEDELLKGLQIPPCTSIPQKPKTACHHDGRAYVLMDKEVECNMEYLANYVSSEKTGIDFNWRHF